MSNAMLAFPNRAADATYSGPKWSTTLPLSYLTSRQLSQVARTVTTEAARSWFYASAASAIDAGVIALCNHNLSTAGQFRVRGFATNPVPRVLLDAADGALPSGTVLTRSSTAYYLDATGTPISVGNDVARPSYVGGVLQGLLFEGAATNQLLRSRTLGTAPWSILVGTAINGTTTGADGVAAAASTVQATSANSVIGQSVAGLNGTRCVGSAWVKRIGGTGTVQMSIDGGTTYNTLTLTTAWQRVQFTGTPIAAQLLFKIVTSGDSIGVDFVQFESGYDASTPIVTTAASASRSADVLTYTPTAGMLTMQTGSLLAQLVPLGRPVAADSWITLRNAGSTDKAEIQAAAAGTSSTFNYTATSSLVASITGAALTMNTLQRFAASYALNDARFSVGGAAGTPDSATTATAATGDTLIVTAGTGGQFALYRLNAHAENQTAANLDSMSGSSAEIVAAYDSGLVNAWPAAWVSGTTAEQRAGVRYPAMHQPAALQTYQWWRIDMSDAANAAGFLQFGRLFIGTAWSPRYNAVYGASIGYIERSSVVEVHGGAEFFADRPEPRVAAIEYPALTDAEGLAGILEMQRTQGTTKEVLFAWNPADTLQAPRRTFLGRLRRMSPLETVALDINKNAIEVKELL